MSNNREHAIALILAARVLLKSAVKQTHAELQETEGDSQGDDPAEQRLSYLLAALDEIDAIDTGPDGGDDP